MYATNYFERAVLNTILGQAFAAPAKVYLALFLSNPTDTGTAGTEVSYPGYARQEVSFSAPVVAADAKSASIKNSGQVSFAAPAADAGTITYIGIYDSAASGNMLLYGKLTEDMAIKAGQAPVFIANMITYRLSGNMSAAYKTAVLNILRGTSMAAVDTPSIALFGGDPETGGSELSGDNYARVPVTFSTPEDTESGQMRIKNSVEAVFNRPTGTWGTLSCVALYSAASGGQDITRSDLGTAIEIKKGCMPRFGVGELKVLMN